MRTIRKTLYFELIKQGQQLLRWSLVVRDLSAAPWVDQHGNVWEYQGPYSRPEAEPIYNAMCQKWGPPVRRVW